VGYRSQVVLALSDEVTPYFMAMLAKNPSVKRLCEASDAFRGDFDEAGGWIVQWDHIKWYEGSPEIDTLNRFIEAMESEDLSEYGEPEDAPPVTWSDHFIFVKVGEDRDDINTSGYGPWAIYPETSIHIGY
jgi:hypothetical protein